MFLERIFKFITNPGIDLTGVHEEVDFASLPNWTNYEVLFVGGLKRQTVQTVMASNPIKWVHTLSAGIEQTLIPEISETDVKLTSSKGCYNEGLADFAISSILHFHRHIPRLQELKAQKKWQKQLMYPTIKGKRLGILGYGAIGTEIGKMAKLGFGIEIVAIKRNLQGSVEYADEVYSLTDLPTILPSLDFLVMSLPSTPSTESLIGAAEISLMKPTAVIVNVGRGSSIDEEALSLALHEERLLGAALDVFKVEPLPEDHFLWTTPRLLISHHTACMTTDTYAAVIRRLEENLAHYLNDEPLASVVDKQAGY
mmetsp:Transcript_13102/g.24493  ORF Transcript_13102/g.24493 Transcript_13102/m.24493 type:complete len:312 (+) Transcript_13102:1713-2648(+)